jgi:hypothetical protein
MAGQLVSRRCSCAALFIFGAIFFCLMQSPPLGASQDIKGYKTAGPAREQRYELPALCQQDSRGSGWWRCTLSPQCAAMADLAPAQKNTLIAQYNQVLFGISMGPASVGRSSLLKPGLVAMIMNFYYAPYTARYVAISIGPTNTSDWANILNQKNSAGKYPLVVSDDLFWLSPAMLMQSIGHEIVHLVQYQRTYSMNVAQIDAAFTAFRELEASTWESGTRTLSYTNKNANFFDCLMPAEQNAATALLRCREWGVKKAIETIREIDRVRPGAMRTLEQWLQEDAWTKAHWLPSNPGWKTYAPGPKPMNCPI